MTDQYSPELEGMPFSVNTTSAFDGFMVEVDAIEVDVEVVDVVVEVEVVLVDVELVVVLVGAIAL